MAVSATPFAPGPPTYAANTHTVGFLILCFLLSFLWFRINGVGVFPLGFVGGLVVAWWSQDIDRAFGKPSQFTLAVVLGLVGMFIGFFL